MNIEIVPFAECEPLLDWLELTKALEAGTITRDAIIADFYDIPKGLFTRTSDDEITLFKNGGGAHLDLMTSRYILQRWQAR